MSFTWDESETERNQAKWEEFLRKLPPDQRDPQKMLSVIAADQELAQYEACFYEKILPWLQSQQIWDIEAYLQTRPQRERDLYLRMRHSADALLAAEVTRAEQIATPAADEPKEAPSASKLPEEDAVWNWGDLVEDGAPDEAEDVIVPQVEEEAASTMVPEVEDEELVSGEVPPAAEETPPKAQQVNEEHSNANRNRDAHERQHGIRRHIRRLSGWFWGRDRRE